MARAGGRAVSKHFHNPIVPTPPRPMKIFILRDQNPGFRVRFTYSRAREERFLGRFVGYCGLTPKRHLEFRGS